jgi:transglutaminase/protease-like cytokinesis protein 3
LEVNRYGVCRNPSFHGAPVTFKVNNTRNDGRSSVDKTIPDRRFIYPSGYAESDDITLNNLAADLTHGLTNDSAKIKALHSYVTDNVRYDTKGYNDFQERKCVRRAVAVIQVRYNANEQPDLDGKFYTTCIGFSNFYAALLRASGVEAKVIGHWTHKWNQVFMDGAWKMTSAQNRELFLAEKNYGKLLFAPKMSAAEPTKLAVIESM